MRWRGPPCLCALPCSGSPSAKCPSRGQTADKEPSHIKAAEGRAGSPSPDTAVGTLWSTPCEKSGRVSAVHCLLPVAQMNVAVLPCPVMCGMGTVPGLTCGHSQGKAALGKGEVLPALPRPQPWPCTPRQPQCVLSVALPMCTMS